MLNDILGFNIMITLIFVLSITFLIIRIIISKNPIVIINSKGFFYRGQRHSWKDIERTVLGLRKVNMAAPPYTRKESEHYIKILFNDFRPSVSIVLNATTYYDAAERKKLGRSLSRYSSFSNEKSGY